MAAPRKAQVPRALLRALAPLAERVGKLPKGAMVGIIDGLGTDLVGDPGPIRAMLPGPLLSFREAADWALIGEKSRI